MEALEAMFDENTEAKERYCNGSKHLLTALVAEQEDGRQLAETFRERQMRVLVFERDSVPWYLGLSLYVALLAVAATCIPHVYPEVGTGVLPDLCQESWGQVASPLTRSAISFRVLLQIALSPIMTLLWARGFSTVSAASTSSRRPGNVQDSKIDDFVATSSLWCVTASCACLSKLSA